MQYEEKWKRLKTYMRDIVIVQYPNPSEAVDTLHHLLDKMDELEKEEVTQHFYQKWSEKEKDIHQVLQSFVPSAGEEVVIKPKYDEMRGFSWVILSGEDTGYFEDFYGDIGTILYNEEQNRVSFIIESNCYSKIAFREIFTRYQCRKPSYLYDQVTSPHWRIRIPVQHVNELPNLITELVSIRNKYPYKIEENVPFVYSSIWDEKENRTLISVMEKADWDTFEDFIHEHYHEDNPYVEELKELLHVQSKYHNQYYTILSENEVHRLLQRLEYFTYNDDFQDHIYLLHT